MDSGTTCDSKGDLNSRVRSRWTGNIKVYARKIRKQAPKSSSNNDTATTTTSTDENSVVASATENPATTTGVSTTSTSQNPSHGTPARTTQSHKNMEEKSVVQESVENLAAGDADDLHQGQEQRASPATNVDETESLELQNPPPQVSGGEGADNLRVSSPFSTENDLPGNTEVAEAQSHIVDELHNEDPASINGLVKTLVMSRFDDRVRYNLSKAAPKNEVMELRMKLEYELDQVRRVVKQLEAKEHQLASCNTQFSNSTQINGGDHIGAEFDNIGGYYNNNTQSQPARINPIDNTAMMRVNSEVVHRQPRPLGLARVYSDMGSAQNLNPRPYSRQLSVAVMENNDRGNEFLEKEKRTPKANQYYRNSEFLLGKDRLPPESNKRLKMNNGRKHSADSDHGFGFGDKNKNQVLKSCTSLLQRLMKHKHGWVFNEPVDAKALGLADYHVIIKHPMDLGTIKTQLAQNRYKSPREFAEDVRLVFLNAMTYNPKGQDVHVMAEQLSQLFEERWANIETACNPHWRYQLYQNSAKVAQSHFAPPVPAYVPAHAAVPVPLYAPQTRTLDIPENVAVPMAVDPKIQRPYVARTPVPKKPKAKDPNKRDMTYEEKQKLSSNLQGLPSEKLDAIVQIIKKRNTTLSQHDDEIEVDIDNVDPETLWELDRFVVNYKKSLSKYKRKAELALQARTTANQDVALMNTDPDVAKVRTENGTGFEKSSATPAGEGQMQEHNRNRSSSSSSSSSGSGSSSSDSDSDSSSADGSAGNSPQI